MLLFLLACRVPYDGTPPDDGSDLDCAQSTWFADADGDGYGDGSIAEDACMAPPGRVSNADDCDDATATTHPTATEVCNGEDDDCDGVIDEDAVDALTWYADADGDGSGDVSAPRMACEPPAGCVADASDCDDGDAAVHPGGAEIPNTLVDEDCDGRVDEIRVCADGTGEFEQINDAIEAAPVEDALIEVCPGTYPERITSTVERHIEIVGETGVAADVTVDGSALGKAVELVASRDTEWDSAITLRGMTFVGGGEGGVQANGWGTVVMSDFVLTGVTGGIPLQIYAQVASFTDCEIHDNVATGYPGWLAYFNVYYPDSFSRCYVHENQAELGVLLMEMPVYNSIFFGNEVLEGGLMEDSSTGDERFIVNNTFIENVASAVIRVILTPVDDPKYGAVYTRADVRNNVFDGNVVVDTIGWKDGCYCYFDDYECSDAERSEYCQNPTIRYNWLSDALGDACDSQWCTSVLSTNANTNGAALDLSAESAPPFALPSDSSAVDRGDPDEQYNDVDGTPNDPGRYGGPLAYP